MPYNILLVDDDHSFRFEFREGFYEYVIHEASCGEDAVKILSKPNEIDIVLLDVHLPGEKGTETLRRIKNINPSLKTIILTGGGTKDIVIESLKGRADDYFEKPLDIERTKKILSEMLENTGIDDNISPDSIEFKIEKIKHYIRRNYDKKVSLNDVSEVTALSPKYLSRVFRENTGGGFSEFKIKVKMDHAKSLLKKGYNVNQVSDMMAYQNAESFVRQFKKTEGITPAEYVRKSKKRAVPKKKTVKKSINKTSSKKLPVKRKKRR